VLARGWLASSRKQQTAVLDKIGSNVSPDTDMMLSEKFGHPCVWVDAASDGAAEIAVQDRLKAVRKELGLTDDQVRTALDSNEL
jgi:hypothetical protein